MMRFAVAIFSVGILVFSSSAATGQNFPTKPIRMLAGEIGGSSDFPARMIAQGISVPLGKAVIVDNRPSNLIGSMVAKAMPDGYTLIASGNLLWLEPLIKKTSYDVDRDFAPITLVTATPQIVIVHPSVAANSIKEMIALAKSRPGELNYASGPSGAPSHLAPELFKAMAGVNIVRVPYKGSGPGLNALIAGEVQFMINNATAAMPHVKSGKVKALAVTSAQPSALLPGLPTVAASGLPGYETVNMFGLLAPAGTPVAIINRLYTETSRVLNQPDVKEKLLNVGAEVVGSSPAEFAAAIKSETAKIAKVIKSAGISAD